MSEPIVECVFRASLNREYTERRKMSEVPALGDEVQFEGGEVFTVISRTSYQDILGQLRCDIYLKEAIHA